MQKKSDCLYLYLFENVSQRVLGQLFVDSAVDRFLKIAQDRLYITSDRTILIGTFSMQSENLSARNCVKNITQTDLVRMSRKPRTTRRSGLRYDEMRLAKLAEYPANNDSIGVDTSGQTLRFHVLTL
jgi:hypothetical protein